MKRTIITVITWLVGIIVATATVYGIAGFVAEIGAFFKPKPAIENTAHHVIYSLSITYQNGDKELKHTPNPRASWCNLDSDCMCLGKDKFCGVREFHYINPAPDGIK